MHIAGISILAFLLAGTVQHVSGQYVTKDWKLHNVGAVIQLVTNNGKLNKYGTDYPGLINTEYPINSYQEHLGTTGWHFGGITEKGDTLVSVTTSHGSPDEFQGYSDALWDTVWVVNRGDTVDIGGGGDIYRPGYTAISDQDFVTRYNDYTQASLQLSDHRPMYLDVIQTSFAWSSSPLDKIIIYTMEVTATELDISDLYIGNFVGCLVGYRTGSSFTFAEDDYLKYYRDKHLGVSLDWPGGPDGGEYTPVGLQMFPPEDVAATDLTWTWIYSPSRTPVLTPDRDVERYNQLKSGTIQANMENPGQPHYLLSMGPIDLRVGDTLRFRIAEILGDDETEIARNSGIAEWLIEQDFKVPSPPPTPPLRVVTASQQVRLDWEPTTEVNPESYADPNRADSSTVPFEGYRVYKSTQSALGPWTLLAEYDVAGNDYGENTGLQREYIDTGLLNNVEYYYSVTAFSKPDTISDFPSQESSVGATAQTVVPGTAPPDEIGEVAVVPNPYRGDADYNAYNPPWEKPPRTRESWMEQDRRVQFINLPERCTIKIFTLAGDLIQTLHHDDPARGYEDWNLTSSVGQAVSSGIYLFTVEENGQDSSESGIQVGKFVIIK